MARSAWVNLNGLWEYAVRDSAAPRPGRFDGKILVPFPIESQLSGVQRAVTDQQRLWYRHTFRLPSAPRGIRWLLHFGAVDWEATVFMNGSAVTTHRGGYDPFTVDVTEELHRGGDQELVVRVWDPTDHGEQPRGKQVSKPESIWYTAVTGIWQTVWLEAVPRDHISALDVRPDVDAGTVTVRVDAAGPTPAPGVSVTALDGDRRVAEGTGLVGRPLTLPIPDAKLWGPGHPFLYSLRVRLAAAGEDSVTSYFGMRKIAVARDSAGVPRLFLNNRPLFQLGTLDQGWWPDGLYTAPTDEARRSDIETLQRLGFNLIRKHVKVEPARWYYDCDRLGMLVWQDMPSGDNKSPAAQREFATELQRVVDALRNHPAIVMWVPFNEGWGQHDTERTVAWLKRYDPTRLVDNASGWTDAGVGDVLDIHDYPGPAIPPGDSTRALVLGEFGGLGLPLDGHTWQEKDNWGYRRYADTAALWPAYRDLLMQLRALKAEGLAAAVYTQTSDVEIEVNGLLTYDRAVVKLPADAAAANRLLYGPSPIPFQMVVPDARSGPQPWRYTTRAPEGNWTDPAYPDSGWTLSQSGFGTDGTPGARVRTLWNTSDLWLRRTFQSPAATELAHHYWTIHHDEDAEVYLNGTAADTFPGYSTAYHIWPLSAAAEAALHPGLNTLAMHVHQTRGGQYADAGLALAVVVVLDQVEGASVTRAPFGRTPDGKAVDVYTLTNAHGMQVRAITYGAIIQTIRVPDKSGRLGDVTLGYDSLEGYLRSSPYFGAVVGRYANRIAKGRFTLEGKTYQLAANNGPNHLHGGVKGFDKVVWEAEPFQRGDTVGVVLRHTSPDGDEGYPGTLAVRVTYTLVPGNELIVDYAATTDKPTPVNLSQHTYFNLAGEGGGSGDILGHVLTIDADRYTPVDATLIPTGEPVSLAGTPFDFRAPTPIGVRIAQPDQQLKNGGGYDHNFVLNRTGHAVHVLEPTSGRTLDISTTEPGLQFYSGNFLDGTITGKAGHVYKQHAGFCLETQHFPDSPNHLNFPSTILRPGQEYRSRTEFAFGVVR